MRKPDRTDRVRKFRLQIAGESLETTPFNRKAWSEAQVWRDARGTPCAYGHTIDGRHRMHLPGVGCFLFQAESDCITVFPEPSCLREVVRDAYRRLVVPMAIQALGQEVLHASAVVAPQGVLVLCGKSGAGKSTLAYGLSLRGFPAWADDAVALLLFPGRWSGPPRCLSKSGSRRSRPGILGKARAPRSGGLPASGRSWR